MSARRDLTLLLSWTLAASVVLVCTPERALAEPLPIAASANPRDVRAPAWPCRLVFATDLRPSWIFRHLPGNLFWRILQSLVLVSSDDTSLTFDDLKTGNFGGATVFDCGTGRLTLFGLFTRDGSFGDFTQRATWSSSNPAVATVSSGDIVFPGTTDSFYQAGTVIPVAAGNAVITASIPISVRWSPWSR